MGNKPPRVANASMSLFPIHNVAKVGCCATASSSCVPNPLSTISNNRLGEPKAAV